MRNEIICPQKELFLVAVLIRTTTKKKQPKCTLTLKWVSKLWHGSKMEYYIAMKKNEHTT